MHDRSLPLVRDSWPQLTTIHTPTREIGRLAGDKVMGRDDSRLEADPARLPSLVVRGSTDPIATRRWVNEMVALLPSGRMAEIEGTGHAVNYSAPEKFVVLIESFLKQITISDRANSASARTPSS